MKFKTTEYLILDVEKKKKILLELNAKCNSFYSQYISKAEHFVENIHSENFRGREKINSTRVWACALKLAFIFVYYNLISFMNVSSKKPD